MNKYPIIYKGKKYEVIWDEEMYRCISIYEEKKILGIKYFKNIYSEYVGIVDKYIEEINGISKDDPNYYIEEAKCLFSIMESEKEIKEKKERTKNIQIKTLAEWNGVISE